MIRRRDRAIARQVPAIAAQEVLRLLVAKGLIERGDAAACLRSIANNIVAHSHACGLGEAGRPYAAVLLGEADAIGSPAESPHLLRLAAP
jgi:hypothetical protein